MENTQTYNDRPTLDILNSVLSAVSLANCRVVIGSYTGTGETGPSYYVKIPLGGKPVFIAAAQASQTYSSAEMHAIVGIRSANWSVNNTDNPNTAVFLGWGDDFVMWYNNIKPEYMLNVRGKVYQYVALVMTSDDR